MHVPNKNTKYLPSIYQEFIYKRSYSRWIDGEKRREDWKDSVERYRQFFLERIPKQKETEFNVVCDSILNLEVMPSMRALWTAGKALEVDNIAAYNCAYIIIDRIKAFAEMMYILLCGTGVGFSIEIKYTEELPKIPATLHKSEKILQFADSKLGWAKGFFQYLKYLFSGEIVIYDLSRIRPEGARLKTFGGRASGPRPLQLLLDYTTNLFENRKGQKLSTLDCHDMCCFIANCVVSGGVRRAACISLSDLNDDKIREAKSGDFGSQNPQRYLANNSAVYEDKPSVTLFLQEWLSLIRSKSGERGIFNRQSAKFLIAQIGRRDYSYDFGCNPCSEVILRPAQFCNLSEVVIRSNDTRGILLKKVRYATILGCIQSTLTNFNFLGRDWKKNCEEERLLGVSLTGLCDHPILKSVNKKAKMLLSEMKQVAIETAEEWAKALEINMPTAITCVKPSGTTSQVTNSSSGLHPRFSPYYIRRVRVSSTDRLCKLLIDSGVNYNPEIGQTLDTANTLVFDFPIKSPETAMVKDEVSAINQLDYWLMLQKYWCEHKPSITVYVNEEEWLEVGNWVYSHWDYVSGIAFLPKDTTIYQLPPYEEIDEDAYETLMESFPKNLDFSILQEDEDQTEGMKEYACSAGSCEL
uniref:ribonucleoside-triphosphate reductase (thioredoxin) n=1 Tax=viral metagenome TaxID=1070528 RepID=A0A6M3JX50_9ZZZZ